MDKLKIIFTTIGVIGVLLAVLVVIGFLYSAIQTLFIAGIICLGVVIAFRLFVSREAKQIDTTPVHKELQKANRILDEYKRKLE